MSDEHERQNSALISAVRQLPARITLVNRGIALAERLLAREREFEIVLPDLRKMSGVVEEHIRVLVGPVDIDEAIATWVPADAGGEWVLDWLKNEGDTVTAGEPLAEVRGASGQSSIPLPSPADGVLTEIVAKRGVVSLGSVVAFVRASRFAQGARDFTEVPASEELVDEEDGRILLERLEEIRAETLAKGDEAPILKLVKVLLISAIEKGASDIHIEPYEKELRVRYRVDGVLYNIMSPPLKFRDAITEHIKIMAKLDIAEKRLPQRGRIKIRFHDNGHPQDIDFLVSCQPTRFGEKVIISVARALAADSRTDASRAYWEGHRNKMLADLGDEATKLLGIEKLSDALVERLSRVFREEIREQAQRRAKAKQSEDATYDYDNDFVARYARGDKALLKEFAKSFLGEWRRSPEGQQKATAGGWGTFHPEPVAPFARVDDSPPRGADEHWSDHRFKDRTPQR